MEQGSSGRENDLPFKRRESADDMAGEINLSEAEIKALRAEFPAISVDAQLEGLRGHLAQALRRAREQGLEFDWRGWLRVQLAKRNRAARERAATTG